MSSQDVKLEIAELTSSLNNKVDLDLKNSLIEELYVQKMNSYFTDKLYLNKIYQYDIIDEYKYLEGGVMKDNILYSAICSMDFTKQKLLRTNSNTTEYISENNYTSLEHANDLCITNDNKLYVATGTSTIPVIDLNTNTETSYTITHNVWSMGYDDDNNKILIMMGDGVRSYEPDFSSYTFIPINNKYISNRPGQGMCYDNGIMYFASSPNVEDKTDHNGINAIIAVDMSGRLLKTWYISFTYGELEFVSVKDGIMYTGFNTDYKTNVMYYKANIRTIDNYNVNLDSITSNHYTSKMMSQSSYCTTIYCNSDNTRLGNGTKDNPFKYFKDAIDYIFNSGKKYEEVIIELNNKSYEKEGIIYITNLNFTIIQNGILNGALISSSDLRFNNITFNLTKRTHALEANHSSIDVRNCIFNNISKDITPDSAYRALYIYRSSVFILSNQFNYWYVPIHLQHCNGTFHRENSFNNCYENEVYSVNSLLNLEKNEDIQYIYGNVDYDQVNMLGSSLTESVYRGNKYLSSNDDSNFNYIQYSSGMLVTWGYVGYTQANTIINFPVAYVNRPVITISSTGSGTGVPQANDITTTGFKYTTANSQVSAYWVAIGNWR